MRTRSAVTIGRWLCGAGRRISQRGSGDLVTRPTRHPSHADLQVLRALCGAHLQVANLLDLQRAARLRGEDTPSLARVCARLLHMRLNKAEQRSDWAQRPLTPSQLAYAALDATVLLQLHDVLQSDAHEDWCTSDASRLAAAAR